ncbi:MAG: hypothetical protein JWQ80_707 [Massilia sp.]|jgi:hypothetical protein|nr:hypothetical protein [Massilia sp.]
MQVLDIDGLIFTFPEDWDAGQFDKWSFYRNQFAKQSNGIKAVDAIAVAPDKSAFLIEVKDYRHPDTEKPSQLPEAIANKVLHTLAAMLPAKLNATDPDEKRLAGAVLKCVSLRVVAHIELPQAHRPAVDLADLRQKLGQLLRAVDAHPKIVSTQNMKGLAWTVT